VTRVPRYGHLKVLQVRRALHAPGGYFYLCCLM